MKIRSNGRPYPRKDNKNRFYFPAEYQKMFEFLKSKQQHTTRVLLNTGARIDEAQHIKVGDIDFENKRLVLTHTKSKAKKGESKGQGRTRIIPISDTFTKYLKGYCKGLKAEDTLSILSDPAINTGLKKAAGLAGIKNPGDFSAHNLRKTLETWLMALGVQDMALTAHIGHDIRTAASHYVSPDVFSYDEKVKIREIIGDLYKRKDVI